MFFDSKREKEAEGSLTVDTVTDPPFDSSEEADGVPAAQRKTLFGKEFDPDDAIQEEVFGDETGHDIQYRKLSWQAVAALMIAEIVSNGTLSLPSTYAIVGLAPAVVLTVFLGVWALFTSFLLIDFKLNHREVHTMGDAGLIMFGPIGREVLAFGTIFFALLAAGTQVVSGGIALTVLSQGTLCQWKFDLIIGCIIFVFSLPRVLNQLNWLAVTATVVIIVAIIVGMIGAGTQSSPQPISAAISSDYYQAFLAVTNPVFAYAGHFMFFLLISEMRNPKDAWKSAVVLQTVATSLYTCFGVVFYVYYGADVASPAFSSLPEVWSKATYGVSLANFCVAGALYVHTAAKLLMVRFFRHSEHIHSHTKLSWGVWTTLCFLGAAVSFILAVAVPVFNELVALAASLFAAWFTYGLAGIFFLYDYRGQYRQKMIMTILCVATVIGGAYICVSGTYTAIRLIVESYDNDQVPTPFTC